MTTDKRYEKIRAISTTVTGDRFAVSEWETNVQVWDINNGLISKLTTDIVSGMTNAISISEDGKQIAIAGYDHKTVTLYNVDNGEIIWLRKDIRRPAKAIILNHYSDLIYIDTENQGSYFLDKKTGETVRN
jgi:WD40 repeat protein